MRILLIIPSLGQGGAERVVSSLSKGFSQLGHNVTVIVFSGPIFYSIYGDLINYNILKKRNKRFFLLRKIETIFRFLKYVRFLKSTIKYYNPDFIYSFIEDANFSCVLAGSRVCVSVRSDLSRIAWWAKVVSKILYRKAHKVISISTGQMCDIKKQYLLNNVKLINNPIDIEEIDKLKYKNLDLKYEFIFSAGRLSTIKNYPLLFNAYASIFEENKNIPKLLIAGDGELKQFLEEYVKKLNLEKNIIFLGSISNPFVYMSKCKFFIHTSVSESFGNVLVEAMACGAVCIATDCPTGPRDIIEDRVNGFLVKNDDITSLVERMAYCLSESNDFTDMKEAAKKSVERFSLKKICLEYLEAGM